VKNASQEVQRLDVLRYFLNTTIRYIAQYVQDRLTELVFNLDEVGISEWDNRKTKSVIIRVWAEREDDIS
jgi:hypothetical protein